MVILLPCHGGTRAYCCVLYITATTTRTDLFASTHLVSAVYRRGGAPATMLLPGTLPILLPSIPFMPPAIAARCAYMRANPYATRVAIAAGVCQRLLPRAACLPVIFYWCYVASSMFTMYVWRTCWRNDNRALVLSISATCCCPMQRLQRLSRRHSPLWDARLRCVRAARVALQVFSVCWLRGGRHFGHRSRVRAGLWRVW